MSGRCYIEFILLIVIVLKVSAQTPENQNNSETKIQYGIQENTPQPTVKSSSGLSEGAKLGLEIGIPIVIAVIAIIGLIIAYKRCRIEIEARDRERRREEREIEMAQARSITQVDAMETDGLVGNRTEPGDNAITNATLRDAAMQRQSRQEAQEDSSGGNRSGRGDGANEPLLDIQLSGIDILAIVKIFTLDELNDVYPRLKKLKTKDFSDILQQDNILQKQTGKILNLWINRNGDEATRNVLIKAMEKCDDLEDSLRELRGRWGNTGLDQPVSEVDIQDIYDTVGLYYLDNVYPYLVNLPKHKIENIKQETKTPPTEQQAKKLFNRWIDRNSIEATRKKIIEAIEKSPDCKGKLGELKREWTAQDTQ